MQLSQSVKLKQKQSLVMTPQLQQAIKLLQLSNLELTQHLQEQVDENPFLELHEPKNSENYIHGSLWLRQPRNYESGKKELIRVMAGWFVIATLTTSHNLDR